MSIKQEMVNGVFWTAVQKYSGFFVQLLVSAILARLLSPEDFGVIAVSTVIIAFFALFTDMGIGPAIIQKRNLTEQDLSSILSFTIYVGLFLALAFFLCAPIIASFYQNQLLVPICRLLSLNLLFASWNIVPNALLMKAKRFKFIAGRTLFLQVIGGGISVFAALRGAGVYSLIIAPLLSSVLIFVINWKQYPVKPVLKVAKTSLEKIFSFSIYQFLFSFINYFSRNIDKLIVGRFYSMHELGYYEKSYRLMLMPLDYVNGVITPVMHPILTSLQDNYQDLANKYNKIIKFILSISFPLGVFLYFAAEDLILLVFGNQWGAAVPVFQVFALSLPLQMILSTTGSIYQAAGKTNWLFYGGLSNTFCTVSGYLIATFCFRTIWSMAWAWDISLLINSIVTFFILYKVVLKSSLFMLLNQFLLPLLSACLLFVVLVMFGDIIPHMGHLVSLAIYTGISFVFSMAFLQCSGQVKIKKVVNWLLNKK